jgi:hypothetical protein
VLAILEILLKAETVSMTKLPFQTTEEQVSKLPAILTEMLLADISPDFAERVMALASDCQGMFELVEMWAEHRDNPVEREFDMQAIVETIWDYEL